MGTPAVRFRDPTSAYSLYALAAHPIEVVCPRCGAHARVIADPGNDQPSTTRPRRLVCSTCGHTETWSPRSGSSWWGAAVDPFFQQPLWLTATVRGHRLWAYNREHLALLAQFATAGLRERGPHGGCSMSMIETLPAWMKVARNRDKVLSAVTRLETRLDDPGRPNRRLRRPARSADLRRWGAQEHRYHLAVDPSPATRA
jgi:ribosomal protein S27AE